MADARKPFSTEKLRKQLMTLDTNIANLRRHRKTLLNQIKGLESKVHIEVNDDQNEWNRYLPVAREQVVVNKASPYQVVPVNDNAYWYWLIAPTCNSTLFNALNYAPLPIIDSVPREQEFFHLITTFLQAHSLNIQTVEGYHITAENKWTEWFLYFDARHYWLPDIEHPQFETMFDNTAALHQLILAFAVDDSHQIGTLANKYTIVVQINTVTVQAHSTDRLIVLDLTPYLYQFKWTSELNIGVNITGSDAQFHCYLLTANSQPSTLVTDNNHWLPVSINQNVYNGNQQNESITVN